MKLTRQEVVEGQYLPPWYYGLAYEDWAACTMVYHIIPINYLLRACRWIQYRWNKFRSRPTVLDEVALRTRVDIQHELDDLRSDNRILLDMVRMVTDAIVMKKTVDRVEWTKILARSVSGSSAEVLYKPGKFFKAVEHHLWDTPSSKELPNIMHRLRQVYHAMPRDKEAVWREVSYVLSYFERYFDE